MFGTDAIPGGKDTPQQVFNDQLYEIYYRFLETRDDYFDYARAPVPPQGRWRIYGLGLSESILRKVYLENAVRPLQLGDTSASNLPTRARDLALNAEQSRDKAGRCVPLAF